MIKVKTSDNIRTHYEDYYKDENPDWRRVGAVSKVDNIVSLCRSLPRASILEIGAGEGSILERLSELQFGDQLYALEISASGAGVIEQKRIARLVECKIFDGYHAPYDNDRFDIAVLSHVLEHVEHPRLLLYEASRVAKYLFVEVPLEDTVRLSDNFVFDRLGHINFYSPKTLRRLVQSCNLRVVGQIIANPSKATYTCRSGARGLINYYIKQALIRLLPTVATSLFTYHCALVCEKELS